MIRRTAIQKPPRALCYGKHMARMYANRIPQRTHRICPSEFGLSEFNIPNDAKLWGKPEAKCKAKTWAKCP